jgi:hypothetical protein
MPPERMPDPVVERARRQSREGFIQYLVACLVLGARPRGWNKPDPPSGAGLALLEAIDRQCFGESWSAEPRFAWEHVLPADESGGYLWPDFAALWPDRTLLFELKTESGSLREGQVDEYLKRALHQNSHQVDLIYLTRDEVRGSPPLEPVRSRYANITWNQLLNLLRNWAASHAPEEERALVDFLQEFVTGELYEGRTVVAFDPALRETHTRQGPSLRLEVAVGPPVHAKDAVEEAVNVAFAVEADRRGRAVNTRLVDRNAVELLKAEVKETLRANPPAHARPWIWCLQTSTGHALTTAGEETGFELRFEYVVKGTTY